MAPSEAVVGEFYLSGLDAKLGQRFFSRHLADVRGRTLHVHISGYLDLLRSEPATYHFILAEITLESELDIPHWVHTLQAALKPSGVLFLLATLTPKLAAESVSLQTLEGSLRELFDERKLLTLSTPDRIAARAVKSGRPEARREIPERVEPVVSVLVPLYNKAPYLAECLDSVLNQDFSDWELIIVDDGSTDGSGEIAERYALAYPQRIRLLHHPQSQNLGPSASRNLAMAKSQAPIVSFLDADDTWRPVKLKHDVEVLRRFPEAAAVISSTLYWWDDGSSPAHMDRITSEDRLYAPPSYFESMYVRKEVEAPGTDAISARISALRELKPWDETLRTAEDLIYFGELAFRFPVYVSGECLSEYRRLHTGLWSTSTADGSEALAHVRVNAWIEELRNEQT